MTGIYMVNEVTSVDFLCSILQGEYAYQVQETRKHCEGKWYIYIIYVDKCGYMWINVDICGYMWIYVDICGYNYAHLSTYNHIYPHISHISPYIPCIPMYPHVVPAFDARNDGFLRNDGYLRMRCSPLLQTLHVMLNIIIFTGCFLYYKVYFWYRLNS